MILQTIIRTFTDYEFTDLYRSVYNFTDLMVRKMNLYTDHQVGKIIYGPMGR